MFAPLPHSMGTPRTKLYHQCTQNRAWLYTVSDSVFCICSGYEGAVESGSTTPATALKCAADAGIDITKAVACSHDTTGELQAC